MSHPRVYSLPSTRSKSSRRPSTAALPRSSARAQPSSSEPRFPRVNDRIDVYWEDRECAFRGTIMKAAGDSGTRFSVYYDDGDRLKHDLDLVRWRFVPPHDDSANDANKCLDSEPAQMADASAMQITSDSQGWFDIGDLGELLRDHQDSTFNTFVPSEVKPATTQRRKRQPSVSKILLERQRHKNLQRPAPTCANAENDDVATTRASKTVDRLEESDGDTFASEDALANKLHAVGDSSNALSPARSIATEATALPDTSPVSATAGDMAPSPPSLLLHLPLRAPRTIGDGKKNSLGLFVSKSPCCLDEFPSSRARRYASNTSLADTECRKTGGSALVEAKGLTELPSAQHETDDGSTKHFETDGDAHDKKVGEQDEKMAALALASIYETGHGNEEVCNTTDEHVPTERFNWTCDDNARSADGEGDAFRDRAFIGDGNDANTGEVSPCIKRGRNRSVVLSKRKYSSSEGDPSEVVCDCDAWSLFRENVVPLRKRLRRHTR